MLSFSVRIFTEEYYICVYMGTRDQITRAGARYCGDKLSKFRKDFEGCRGQAINTISDGKHPLIIIDSDLKASVALATLSHEASHAMDYIERHIGIRDKSGEFHGHGIAAVVRTVMK